MFLNALKTKNEALLKTAVAWHQEGKIPASCWLMDLDTIAYNADILARAKKEHHLETYVMAKQYGRNPLVSHTAIAHGLNAVVCVDVQCVRLAARYGVKVGHVGHLNQIPHRDIPFVLSTHPEVWTVYSVDQAKAISDAAVKIGMKQPVMMRIYRPDDVFFDGQEGGFPFAEYEKAAAEIKKLPGVILSGVTSFPCLCYNNTPEQKVAPSPNLETIRMAAKRLQEMGFDIRQINAPGNTSSYTFPMLAQGGATHVEPGHGLLGTTMPHHFDPSLPEKPAYCYVTEISHHFRGMGYALGGGLFRDVVRKGFSPMALVGKDWESMQNNECTQIDIQQIIDYHIPLKEGEKCRTHDTVICGFRTQMHMTRGYVAIASGVQAGKPELLGLFDHAGNMLDEATLFPLPNEEANARIKTALEK